MTTETQVIVDQFLALPWPAPDEVLTQLMKGMEFERQPTAAEQAEIKAAWDTEIQQRANEVKEGRAELLDGEEALRAIRKKFGV